MSSSPKCTMGSPQCHTGHSWQSLASRGSSIASMGSAMNCPVQVAAVSEAEMLSQNARPSEDPTVPQHRQSGEMLEETYNQEDGREDVYERGCSIPKGCTPGSLQPIDDIHQGKETLNVAMGDLHQQSDTGKPEGWKTPSEAHEGVADRRNCCVHNPNLLHCPLDQ